MRSQDLIAAFDTLAEAPDGVSRLRELVLQLAVRGKLVPQEPEDEPADRLLKRIRDSKHTFVADHKIRAARKVEDIGEEEQPYDLPDGWAWCRMGELANAQAGFAFKSRFFNDEGRGLPLIRIRDVVNGITNTFYQGDFRPEFIVTAGELLIGMDGNFNIGSWRGRDALLNQRVTRLRWYSPFPVPAYVVIGLQHRLNELQGTKAYTTVQHLSGEQIENAPIALPPLEEQHRIIAKVNELMGLLDRLEATRNTREGTRAALRDAALAALQDADTPEEVEVAWERIAERIDDLFTGPADVDPLRQTVLQLAVRGRLVLQDPNDEPAKVLLERVAEDRKVQVAAKVARLGNDPGGYETEELLPFGWEWAPLQHVVRFIDYRGKTPKKTSKGVRLITAKNIRDGYIDQDPEEFVSPETYKIWMTRGFPRLGDVLFTTEAPMGKAALVELTEEFALAQRAIDFQPYADFFGKFLMWMLLSPWFQERLRQLASGMTATGIKGAKLRQIRVPIPPLAEQHRIVAKVDELMSLLDRLEERLNRMTAAHDAFAAAEVHHLDA